MTLAETRARVDVWVTLHTVDGLSTRQIAREFGANPSSVKKSLKVRGVLRPSPGKDIERDVWFWLVGQANSLMRVKGDRPFDLLADGERIDVKSAKECQGRYTFALHHKDSKRTESVADWYWLVLKDRTHRPIYRCRPSDIQAKLNFNIPLERIVSEERFEFVGFLGQGVVDM